MPQAEERISNFVKYASALSGSEKSEAQVFLDRFFQAFGHAGYQEAGATLEARIRRRTSTAFADLLWPQRLLLEMKSRGEDLADHYQQAFEYWIRAAPHRPRYVVLCNFDEFWIYDFDEQLDEPKERVRLVDLPTRAAAFGFMQPTPEHPRFAYNRVAVTQDAASNVAKVFTSAVARGEDRTRARLFTLQCVVAMFSEHIQLLPPRLFVELLDECKRGASSFDMIGALFHQMNSPTPARAGRFRDVRYFNGGLYRVVDPIELTPDEIALLADAAEQNWSQVDPAVFGNLFQGSMDDHERHAYGAHFTSEADIQKVVLPTIVSPWRERIEGAKSLKQLLALRNALRRYRVLDPACGSGNFLYVAYRELVRLDMSIVRRIYEEYERNIERAIGTMSLVSARQFYGLDINSFAVDLAKVTLMLAKKLALDEVNASALKLMERGKRGLQVDLPFSFEHPLPLDDLDQNIIVKDALLGEWPDADVIIGNPPFQSHTTIKDQLGADYVDALHARYPEIPGKANYCVFWFRRAHDHLAPDHRAGLIGTNNIRSNESRKGGLDYIVKHGGEIVEAVSSQVWSGDAAVHVSIVNWIKGHAKGKKVLLTQVGDRPDSPWRKAELDVINSSLSFDFDVAGAAKIRANQEPQVCYQGQTHGDDGFLLSIENARAMAKADPRAAAALRPYLTGDNILRLGRAGRYVIDLNSCPDIISAMAYGAAFTHVQASVMPMCADRADKERGKTRETARQKHFKKWWRFWRSRNEMVETVSALPRYFVCVRHTRRPIFEFVHPAVRPNDALTVFALADDYSFGVLQSDVHWRWFMARCSMLKADWRYTSETVFDSFPWPQRPTAAQVRAVAGAARELRCVRRTLMAKMNWNLRTLYQTASVPGTNPLVEAHAALERSVRDAYGLPRKSDALEFILRLNEQVARAQNTMQFVQGPGVPATVKDADGLISDDVGIPGVEPLTEP